MRDYICFFSKEDMTLGYYLEKAEKRIHEITSGSVPTDLSGIIELWHIRRMMEEDCRLTEWTDNYFGYLKTETDNYKCIIANYFNKLKIDNIESEYESLEWTYKNTFWTIIEEYKLYDLIKPEVLRKIATNNINDFRAILTNRNLVEKFKFILHELLLNDKQSALFILDEYAVNNKSSEKRLFFPSNLTLEDKEHIIINYLESGRPNLNYVRLITQIKDDSNKIILSPKTKLKAEKLEKQLKVEIFSNPNSTTFHTTIHVIFNDQTEKIANEKIDDNGNITFEYSTNYIKRNNNFYRIAFCVSGFKWTNPHCLLNLINKKNEDNTFDILSLGNGRDSYPCNTYFHQKNTYALLKLLAYNEILTKLGSSFEKELKQFYEEYLRIKYYYPSLPINFPRENDSYLNKCRIICPELDSIVKQYNTYVEEDEIDKDLIRISKPLKVEDANSLIQNKYYEIVEDKNEIQYILLGLFGSSNSILHYVHPFEDKHYHSLIELLENEETVKYSNYKNFQKRHLDILVENNLIGIDSRGYLYIVNQKKIEVLKCLWEYQVCSYWNYKEEERRFLDEMLHKGWLQIDGHLLSRPERDFFSYYLDNRSFTNGMAYRNLYAHGSTSPAYDENTHLKAYISFLMLLSIIIIKIENDLWLSEKIALIEFLKNINNIES